jgi:hypothetical protein
MRLPLLAAVCCALLASAARPHCAAAAKARHFKWEISNMFWSPDCEEKVVIGINGQFPGPTIRARAGDTIHVELKNALHTEGVVIHWHGIRQVNHPSLTRAPCQRACKNCLHCASVCCQMFRLLFSVRKEKFKVQSSDRAGYKPGNFCPLRFC